MALSRSQEGVIQAPDTIGIRHTRARPHHEAGRAATAAENTNAAKATACRGISWRSTAGGAVGRDTASGRRVRLSRRCGGTDQMDAARAKQRYVAGNRKR